MKPIYKLGSKWLLEDVLTKYGDKPDCRRIFKKSSNGLLVHTTVSFAQYLFGVFFVLAVSGVLYVLYASLQKEVQKGKLTAEAFGCVFVGIQIVLALSFLVLLFFISKKRTVWLSETLNKIKIKNSIFFISSMQEIDRSELQAVRLQLRYPTSSTQQYWSISIEHRNGRVIPITMNLFSYRNASLSDFSKEFAVAAAYPRVAWVLCRTLDVPLHIMDKDMDVSIRSAEEFPSLSDSEKKQIKEKHDIEEKKTQKEFRKMNIQYGFIIGAGFVIFIGISIVEILKDMKISKIQIMMLATMVFTIITGALVYYLLTRRMK